MTQFLGRLRKRIEVLQRKVDAASPPALFAGYLFFSLVMLIATAGSGLATISATFHGRTKGFFWELNWGINHMFLIPVGLFCCAQALREVRRQANSRF